MKAGLKKHYSLIIFDWDGTVVDSVPSIVEALKRAALDQRLPILDDQAYKDIIGLSLQPACQRLYPALDISGIAALMEGYKTHHRALLDQQPALAFTGAIESLQELQDAGLVLAVATGKGQVGLQKSIAVNHAGSLFQCCKTADDARSKPDPDKLEQILKELGVSAEQALMVGDSGFDMQMAHNAGIDCVAVSYGAQSADRLKAWQPVLIIDHFANLIDWLGLNKLEEVI